MQGTVLAHSRKIEGIGALGVTGEGTMCCTNRDAYLVSVGYKNKHFYSSRSHRHIQACCKTASLVIPCTTLLAIRTFFAQAVPQNKASQKITMQTVFH